MSHFLAFIFLSKIGFIEKKKYAIWCEDPLGQKYKMIIKYVKISHPSLTHNDKFDKEGYTITLCFRSSALVRSMAVWWALDQKGWLQ